MLNIYHNPRCSKSRQTLALLEANGHAPAIIEYMKELLTEDHIRGLLEKLGFESARDLMRKGEAAYKEAGLKGEASESVLIAAMASEPRLIERPIVETADSARLGRPPENVLEILST